MVRKFPDLSKSAAGLLYDEMGQFLLSNDKYEILDNVNEAEGEQRDEFETDEDHGPSLVHEEVNECKLQMEIIRKLKRR